MISRRALIAVAPLVAVGGCSAQQKALLSKFAATAYADVNVVAAFLENLAQKVAAGALTAANAATQFAAQGAPYIVPGCQLFVSLVKLAGQLAAADPTLAKNATFTTTLGQATTLANNSVIQAAAANGTVPSDPVTVLTGVIQLVAQIMTLTSGRATPTAAASAA